MKKIAILLAATMVAGGAVAAPFRSGEVKPWTINVQLALPQDDHKDNGVDNMVGIGIDYDLGAVSADTPGNLYVGALYVFGSGDFSLKTRTYGAHVGLLFNLGENQALPLAVKLQAGYYNTRLSNGSADDKWAIGGLLGLVYKPAGAPIHFEGGYYIYPEVNKVDNRGFYIGAGFRF